MSVQRTVAEIVATPSPTLAGVSGPDVASAAVRDPDPRVARTRRVVLSATADLLATAGFERLTIEGVAKRSGVAKSTIYRNWASRAELLVEAFERLAESFVIPDTGSLVADLEAVCHALTGGLADEPWGRALPSLVGAAAHDPELAKLLGVFARRRLAGFEDIFTRAIHRGELHRATDAAAATEDVVAPLVFRALVTRQTVAADDVRALCARRLEQLRFPGPR